MQLEQHARVRFTSGTIEALKWFALVCMVIDHAGKALNVELGPWAMVAGRLAFPIFALVFGYNLARPGVDRLRVAGRILLVACLVTPLYASLLGVWPLNVLFTLALAALVIEALERGQGYLAAALLVSSLLVDYLLPGVVLVTVAYGITRRGLIARRVAVLAFAMVGLCWLNGNAWALLSLPLLWAASRVDVDVPRLRWAFYLAYPLHLVVLLLLRG